MNSHDYQLHVNPGPIFQTTSAFMSTQILKSGIDLDVFTNIAEGKTTVADIAEAAGANPRAMRYLLDALCGMDYLKKLSPKEYSLTPVSESYLVKTNPSYLGLITKQIEFSWQPWEGLSEVIKTGNPAQSNKVPEIIYAELAANLFPTSYPMANRLADKLEVGKSWKGFHLLDIAAGAAPWSIAFAQRDPDIKVTAIDYPEVLEVANQYTSRFGVAKQYAYLSGNIRDIVLDSESFDAALLCGICHVEGESHTKALFNKVYAALKSGGRILISDIMADEARSTATFALIFAVSMLINSEEGDTFTFNQFKVWLEEIGFKDIELIEFPGPTSVVQAFK